MSEADKHPSGKNKKKLELPWMKTLRECVKRKIKDQKQAAIDDEK